MNGKFSNIIVFILIVFLLFGFAGISSGETLVSGTISTDTTWDLAGSPYVILDAGVSVRNGVTLSLDPGLVVKFESPNAYLRVFGKLNASGTSDNKIIFTSIKDDSYGGDTNGDGDATTPTSGDWACIELKSYLYSWGIGIFDHVIVKYGGSSSDYPANIYSYRSDSFSINNSIIEYSQRNGIYSAYTNAFSITNSIIEHSQNNGIRLFSTHNSKIISNNIYNNSCGLNLESSNNNRIFHNNFINNSNQASDNTGTNTWNDSYPSGGNYWSDYTGTDSNGDGIGDTPTPSPAASAKTDTR